MSEEQSHETASNIIWEEPTKHGTLKGVTQDGCEVSALVIENYRTSVSVESADGQRFVSDYVPATSSIKDGLIDARRLAETLVEQGQSILQNLKTMEGWEKSDTGLYDYLSVGDRVDMDMVKHFRETLPPTTNRGDMVQAGEPYDKQPNPQNERLDTTYATFVDVGEKTPEWVFAGNCFKESLAPNIEALATVHPKNIRLANALQAYSAVTQGKPVQKVAWSDKHDQFHEHITASHDEARQLVTNLFKDGMSVSWNNLDSKDPRALHFTEGHATRVGDVSKTKAAYPKSDMKTARASQGARQSKTSRIRASRQKSV